MAAGTTTTAIRPDVLSASPVSGAAGSTPLGFTTQDNTTNGFRQLAAAEYTSSPTSGVNTNNNVLATAPFTIPAPAAGRPRGQPDPEPGPGHRRHLPGQQHRPQPDRVQSQFVVKSGGILVCRPGVTSTLTTPYLNQGNPFYFHTYGNLTVNGTLIAVNGLVKSGTGNLTLGDGAVRYTGVTGGGQFIGINDGTTTLGANNNSFMTTTGGAVLANDMYLAGGSIDVNGNSQTFRIFTSNNNSNEGATNPGAGGTITNSGATAASLTIFGTGNLNPANATGLTLNNLFTGSVNGNLNLVKSANGNTLEAFNGVSNFSGTTTVRGTALILRDSGQFTNTSAVTVDYGNLSLDSQFSLSNVNNRLPANVPVTLRGGTIDLRAPGLQHPTVAGHGQSVGGPEQPRQRPRRERLDRPYGPGAEPHVGHRRRHGLPHLRLHQRTNHRWRHAGPVFGTRDAQQRFPHHDRRAERRPDLQRVGPDDDQRLHRTLGDRERGRLCRLRPRPVGQHGRRGGRRHQLRQRRLRRLRLTPPRWPAGT